MLKRIKQETNNQNINPRNLIRNILMISAVILFIGFIVYSPITQKAANAPSYELSFDMDTLKLVAGQSAKVKVNIERNGFEEPVTLKAEDLPDGFNFEFEENPVEGDSTTAWIYSPVNVLGCENPIVVDSYEDPEPNAKLRVLVNCGIEWAEQFGSPSPDALHNDEDIGNAVTTDSDGNVYVVGQTFGTVDPQTVNQGNSDVWLAKYSNGGTQEWIRQLGGEGEDRVAEVKVDTQGDVFVGGTAHDGAIPPNSAKGNTDYWLAKYNSNGEIQWVHQDGSSGQDGKFGMAIIPDNQGGARLATLINERTGVAVYDYSSSGNPSYIGGGNIAVPYRNSPRDLVLSENGELYVVGYHTVNGLKSGYILKCDITMGTQTVWFKNDLSITGDRDATRVILDSNGDLFVAGTDKVNGSDINAWFGKFSRVNGASLWSQHIKIASQPNQEDRINTLGINSDGDLVAAGSTTGVLGTRSGSGEDAWSARYDSSSGDLVWFNQYAVSDNDSFEAVAFDNNDGVFFAGRTKNWKTSIGSDDALLMKFVDSVPTFITPQITNTYKDPALPGFFRIEGYNLLNVSEVRVNGIPYQVFYSSPELITIGTPPNGDSRLSVSANCHTLIKDITIN